LRGRLRELARDIKRKLDQHDLGKLLTIINGIGSQTAAYLIGELGDPARFRSSAALASYVGVAPRLRQSGKRRFSGTAVVRLGYARLRKALWMPVLTAVRFNRGCELTTTVWFRGKTTESGTRGGDASCSRQFGASHLVGDYLCRL
jgi:transposase